MKSAMREYSMSPSQLEDGKWYFLDEGTLHDYYLCQFRNGKPYLRPRYCLEDCYWQSAESLLKEGMAIIGESPLSME